MVSFQSIVVYLNKVYIQRYSTAKLLYLSSCPNINKHPYYPYFVILRNQSTILIDGRIMYFVKTAVAESSDGISFDIETRQESEEVHRARQLAAKAQNKPLFEQLAEREMKKQEQYDATTKLIFGN